ncbi:hypothetical protein QFZ51_004367 [Chitinophaga sp. W3I9]|uniref:alpha/beta hydrolase family protein n=1 Tax=Chitinophaga sp. W3I9 TaxID=3373924 RepID=UPI003D190016
MRKRSLLLYAALTGAGILPAAAQQKVLDTAAYKEWKRIGIPVISYYGDWVMYDLPDDDNPQKHLVNTQTSKEILLDNTSGADFFNKGKWLKYNVNDSLMLMRLKDGKKIRWTTTSFISNSQTSPYISYNYKTAAGSRLVIWNTDTNDSTILEQADRYSLSGKGQVVYLRGDRLMAGPLKGRHTALFSGPVTDYSFNPDKEEGTLLSGTKLYAFSLKKSTPQLLMDFNDITAPPGYRITQKAYEITPGTTQLLLEVSFNTARKTPPKPNPNAADLELWTWNEPVSQRRQRRGVYDRTMMDDAKFIYHLDTKQLVQVAPEYAGMLFTPQSGSYNYALLTDQSRYEYMLDWKYSLNADIYLVNVHTGERKLVAEDCTDNPQWSPNGRFAVIYNGNEKQWQVLKPEEAKFVTISAAIGYPVYEEDFDLPKAPPSYGMAGWTDEGNTVIVYDRYDMWAIDLTGKQSARCITGGYGRQHHVSFRLQGADYGGMLDLKKALLLRSFNEQTKSGGLYRLNPGGKAIALADDPAYTVKVISVAGNGNAFVFARQSYRQYPDIWWGNAGLTAVKRLTNRNPQQAQYGWGSAKVVEWKNYEGKQNQGLLYLPENFDTTRTYPMIVDFYETHSHDLHEYLVPGYSTSTIDIPTYVSNGYVVFRPDIHYTTGKPGESAYNAVVSGVMDLISRGIADKAHIGLQGHSFAGFEVAYIATRSNLFKCVNIGAGAVNVTYNYTAVRSNGAPGMFKCEVEQYRLGKTLWEDKEAYIANSPIFNADKITSPLLIFHNDKDGAVAFTQGLDLFLAMRRLRKPAWLLNYKGLNHTLEEEIPQQDWTLRMGQFFDHYLKDKPMPRWMKEGISVDERKVDPKYAY